MREALGSALPRPAVARPIEAARALAWSVHSGGLRLRGATPPALAAATLTALMLHLIAELAGRLRLGDPVADMSVMVGISAVLAMLFPFAALCLHRLRVALRPDAALSE